MEIKSLSEPLIIFNEFRHYLSNRIRITAFIHNTNIEHEIKRNDETQTEPWQRSIHSDTYLL